MMRSSSRSTNLELEKTASHSTISITNLIHTITMPYPTLPLSLCSFFSMLLFLNSGYLTIANGQRTWCIANPSTMNHELIANLDYACGNVNCSQIQQGSLCFYPDSHMHHASFAMNLYYQAMGRRKSHCNFTNSGLISTTDPSTNSCTYESGGALADNQTRETWCLPKPTTSDAMLQEIINFACNHVDCSAIHDASGPCFNPTTRMNHAAFAMNLYYQGAGRRESSCDFSQTGLIVTDDPSYGDCKYEYHE